MANFSTSHHLQCTTTNTTTSMRQNKWLEKFENLLCALNTEKDKKGKAMSLQYAGDRDKVYDIYYSIMHKEK